MLPGTRTEIAEGTGEIIFNGRHIMMGYLKNEAATSDTIDADGWCHSGDIGAIDDGLLKVTGRIKELLITGGGENVAPVPIEDTIKKHLPAISNVMVIGDKRKFLSCIVTLKTTPTPDGLSFTNQLDGAATKVADATTVEEAMASAEFKKYVEAGIAAANKEAVSNAQKVQKFIFVTKDFSVAGGELTPTMKLKRKVVSEMYATEIEAMYT